MPEIYGSHFEFGGTSSRTYGLIIANESTDRSDLLYGGITGQTIFDKKGNKRSLIGDDYSESPLSLEVEIFSDDFMPILPEERRTVEKWLFKASGYRKLYLDTLDDENFESGEFVDGALKRLYLNCRFINPEKIYSGEGVIGYKATLETDSGLFWQDAITKTITSSDIVSNKFTITTDTDLYGYIYPKVVIVTGSSSGNVELTNLTDDSTRKTKFTSVPASTSITLRNDLNMVTPTSLYTNFATRNFIRLLDGDNEFQITGSITSISFEYQNRRTF